MKITIEAETGEKNVVEIDMPLAIVSENPIEYIACEIRFCLEYFPTLIKWRAAFRTAEREKYNKLVAAGIIKPITFINKTMKQVISESKKYEKELPE